MTYIMGISTSSPQGPTHTCGLPRLDWGGWRPFELPRTNILAGKTPSGLVFRVKPERKKSEEGSRFGELCAGLSRSKGIIGTTTLYGLGLTVRQPLIPKRLTGNHSEDN